MFLDFYELKEQPFGVTPDPHYLYLGGSHREALASLFYGVKTGRGLLALIAPPGMGKTTLLFRFLEHLRRSARTAFLFQTQCDSCGLLRYLLGDLGINTRGQDFVTMHEQLNELLLREARAGRRFVLVIDEAQNLDDSVLETARLLSDFETPSEKLLQIVFAGQSQLAEKLERPELAQLRQRISILGRLEPFSATEVIDYINHRLRVAGYNAGGLFTPAAFERIAANSKGIPRNINNLCFNALSLGCALGRKQIDADLIGEAEADLDLSSLAEQRRRELLPVVRSVPAGARPPAAEVMIYHGAEATTSPAGVGELALMKTLSTGNDDPAHASWSFDAQGDGFAVDEGADLLIFESLEHAQERNAEILAEIVGNGTSGDAYHLTEPAENGDSAYRVMKATLKDAEPRPDDIGYVNAQGTATPVGDVIENAAAESLFSESAEQLPVSATTSMTGHLLGGVSGWDAGARLPISYAAERTHTLGRVAVGACVFVMALLAVVLYRQDIKIAATQTRRTLVVAAASLSSHRSAVKAALAAPIATLEQVLAERGSELTDRRGVVSTAAPALTTPVVATQAGASPVTSAREQQAPMTNTSDAKGVTSAQVQLTTGTTTVIVQPHDDLRRICLRYLGSYDPGVVSEISELNPQLTDLDHIVVGQRIVLPASATVRTSASESSLVPRP
jgi:type II secretory pathway predicted ATPase ExeA